MWVKRVRQLAQGCTAGKTYPGPSKLTPMPFLPHSYDLLDTHPFLARDMS